MRVERIERFGPDGLRLAPMAFRASGGLVALLQADPAATAEFMYESPKYPAYTTTMRGYGGNPSLGSPVDIALVTDSTAWFVDASRGRIVSQNLGGLRQEIVTLRDANTVRRAGALDEDLVVFFDDSAGVAHVQRLSGGPTTRLRLPDDVGALGDPWNDWSLSGSLSSPCVMFSPFSPTVLVMSRDTLLRIDLASAPLGDRRVDRQGAWRRLALRLRGPSREMVGPLDVTAFPTGIAALSRVGGDSAGMTIDLFDLRGEYQRSLVLSRPALRIAGALNRLYVLSQMQDSAMFASYPLPLVLRSKTKGTLAVRVPSVP
ncbi:MAG: hypothetical protein ACT4P7_10095 [Gemmatimonadaceae bacterium]